MIGSGIGLECGEGQGDGLGYLFLGRLVSVVPLLAGHMAAMPLELLGHDVPYRIALERGPCSDAAHDMPEQGGYLDVLGDERGRLEGDGIERAVLDAQILEPLRNSIAESHGRMGATDKHRLRVDDAAWLGDGDAEVTVAGV